MIDREGCILLNMISGIGYAKYRKLIDSFGCESAVFKQSLNDLNSVPGIGDVLSERIAAEANGEKLKRELELCERGGVRLITLHDEDYPLNLRELYDPPLCLYVRGALPDFSSHSLAVVGSRRMSRYGERMTYSIASEAARHGYAVVSGLAAGVDTVAHRAAVEAQGVTVAVLGGGLMRLYPADAAPLARSIIESGGGVISEFPLEFPVSRTSFPRRNRIVAALGRGVVVIEAGLESGAMITANLGRDYGREVMAVPGQADSPLSGGCHQLIKSGASLVENFNDILQIMEGGLFSANQFRRNEVRESSVYDADHISGLDETGNAVFALLREKEHSLEELVLATDWDTGKLSAALMKLELAELIDHDAAQIYRAKC